MPELDYEHIDRIVDLIESYLSGEITNTDKDELMQWICQNEANLTLFEKLVKQFASAEDFDQHLSMLDNSLNKEEVEKMFIDHIRSVEEPKPFFRKYRQLFSIAAGILILISGMAVLYLRSLEKGPTDPETLMKMFTHQSLTAGPAAQKTVIRVGNDAPIVVENVLDTILFTNEHIAYSNGTILSEVYDKSRSTAVLVETPYNGKVNLRLEDGSQINLHPGSSVKFPLSFADAERKIIFSGEAFFHVQKTKRKQPFKIDILNEQLHGPAQVTVLGTSFWISSFSEQNFFETGVLEGVVEVNYYSQRETLVAGKSAITSEEGIESKEFDIIKLSPKLKGKLSWYNNEIGTILLTLKKWYNIELDINKEFDLTRKFTLTFDPEQEISENLKILTYVGITLKLDTSTYPNKLHIIN